MKTCNNINKKADCTTIDTFERNKFFYGKLLSVDDFQTEQDYFRKKNRLLNRSLEGSGIIHGLEVSNIESVNNGISLQITAGYALDSCGDLIVVENDTTVTIPTQLTDETLYLSIHYLECNKDRVASISESSNCEEHCCYNRISEIYEFKIGNKPPAENNNDAVLISVLTKNETSYLSDTTTCKYIDSNQELAKKLFDHENNTDNPHQVSAKQVKAIKSINEIQNWGGNISFESTDGSININPNTDAKTINITISQTVLSALDSKIMAIKTNLDMVLRFLMDKALKYKLKAFTNVFEYFESEIASEIIKATQEAIDNRIYINEKEFFVLMEYLSELEGKLIEEIRETDDQKQVVEKQLELYEVAIQELKKAIEKEDLFAIAVAQDEVCERAEWLIPVIEKVKVPKITTLQIEKARKTLANKGLFIGELTHTVSDKPQNSVLTQDPKTNTEVEKGSSVDVTVAIKANKVIVPNVVELNILNARKNITHVGLKVGTVTEEIRDDVNAGTVLSQKPLPDTEVDPASLVNLVIAKAQEKTRVPQLVNEKQANAQEILQKYKLKLGTVTHRASHLTKGTILEQTPKAGTTVNINNQVSIVVATSYKMTTVPNLVGYGEKDGKKIMELMKKANLQEGNVSYQYSSKPKGTILDQTPKAGAKVVVGSAVDVTVAKNRLIYEPLDPIIASPVNPGLVDPINPVGPINPDIVLNPVINPSPFINPLISDGRDKTVEDKKIIKK